jgi:mannose-6-phosphate isomerase-like protein (cupin superfamily)
MIPQHAVHRLENPGSTPAIVIETQIGAYLGEDDIERIQDDYNRGE